MASTKTTSTVESLANAFNTMLTSIFNAFWLIIGLITSPLPAPPRLPTLTNKRICLLIAHPDDEAMFFAPTLLALNRPPLSNQVFVLCLSSGDADGLGSIRKHELVKSALQLGITHAEHIVTLEDARFPDSMSKHWDAEEISKVLTHYFAPKATAAAPVPVMIDAIVTFDRTGVSEHPNHKSLYHGATAFVKSLRRPSWETPVKLYILTSTNILRKYSGFLDCLVTLLLAFVSRREQGAFPTPILSISGPDQIRRAQLAMTTAHKSQMRWFRWAWISISRYMIVNDLVKVNV